MNITGITFVSIYGAVKGADEIIFTTISGHKYKMWHEQNCCEAVQLDDLIGDISDLLNSPILSYEEVSNSENQPTKNTESWTWTFYKFQTAKGFVTLRWLGESNGYYSEKVTFRKIEQ